MPSDEVQISTSQPSNSRHWITTHVANASFITYDAIHATEDSVDECHYTTDNTIVYTYVHFTRRISIYAFQSIIKTATASANIVLTEVFGYESIINLSGNAPFNDHIGLKVLIGHYQSNDPKFTPCTDGIRRVSRGILWRSNQISRIKEMVHTRNKSLSQFLDTMISDLQHHKQAEEYDVVKKRKKMETVTEDEGDESCPAALARFEDFESHVLHALDAVTQFDTKARHDDLLGLEAELEQRMQAPVPRHPLVGGVYVAKSKSVSIPKIGATRRTFAERHKGLRVVPSPFQLVYWIPSATPFKIENAIHKHFNYARIREAGGNSEFFNVDLKTIGTYLKATYPDVIDNLAEIEKTT